MKCYNHHDRDAFGICKSCGKALCLECMADDIEHGVYCADDIICKNRGTHKDSLFINKGLLSCIDDRITKIKVTILALITIFIIIFVMIFNYT